MVYDPCLMALERMLQLIFVVYCTTVGTILLLLPWSAGWDHLLVHLPYSTSKVLETSWLRGALSGFGLVHLVWGAHDLQHLLAALLPDLEDRGFEER